MAPAVGMLAGFFIEFVHRSAEGGFRRVRYATALGLILLVLPVLYGERAFFFATDRARVCHQFYKDNFFAEAVPVAAYLKSHSGKDDRIFVFGSEPEIYFYADRLSATGYIYMYDLAFAHPYKAEMQKEMMRQVEQARPEFVVVVANTMSWARTPGEADALFPWFDAFTRKNRYQPVGWMDYHYPEPSEYTWGDAAADRGPKSTQYMCVLKRQD